MKGYKAFSGWANSLTQKSRERFNCYCKNGKYLVPSEYIIRDILVRVDPECVDKALQKWKETHSEEDESLAIDGKIMCNAIDKDGKQTHIMSAVGYTTSCYYTKKKVGTIPKGDGSDEEKQTNEIKIAALMLDQIDIEGKNITADALLTQREFAGYLVAVRKAYFEQ